MSTITTVSQPSKFIGTAELNWCPECGHKLVATQLKLAQDMTIDGKKCSYCHYIHKANISSAK